MKSILTAEIPDRCVCVEVRVVLAFVLCFSNP